MQLRTELETAYRIKVLAIGCDLSRHDSVRKITSLLSGRGIVPDVLINNAGFGVYGSFEHTATDSEIKMIQLNVTSLTELTKIIYRQMRSKGKGRILNLASIASFMPGAWMTVYHATKAYVLSFSEALAVEAKGSGVTVTALCPGPTATGFENRASAGTGIKAFKKFGKLPTAKDVAKYAWKSMMAGKTVAIPGKKFRWLLFLTRFMSRKAVANIAGKMQAPNKNQKQA
jgi:short-subunit dehydrogenase